MRAELVVADEWTDEGIADLIAMPKRIVSGSERMTQRDGHLRTDLEAVGDDEESRFVVKLRRNQTSALDFSAVLVYRGQSGRDLTLLRYNGCTHGHRNPIEKTGFVGEFHRHIATQRYILSGNKAEHFAVIDDRFECLDEAIKCLSEDANIDGLQWSAQKVLFQT